MLFVFHQCKVALIAEYSRALFISHKFEAAIVGVANNISLPSHNCETALIAEWSRVLPIVARLYLTTLSCLESYGDLGLGVVLQVFIFSTTD